MELLERCGVVREVWSCWRSVELLERCGVVGEVWSCWRGVELLERCGVVGEVRSRRVISESTCESYWLSHRCTSVWW